MKKVHYVISGYIPSDENKIIITTYKFQEFGCKDKYYGWISLEHSYGIGTGTDDFGETDRDEALMKVFKFIDRGEENIHKHIYTNNFEEVLNARSDIYEKLWTLLADKKFKEDE